MIGQVLGGRYEILGRLGSGGMSVVYRAKCAYLEREVAVKILRERYADDAEFLQHFRREARAAARLSHPNIVNVHDVGEDPERSQYYIIMECVSGKSLKDLILQEGPLEPGLAMDIACQILSALSCAHEGGVIHRDIKPDNVIIDDATGTVKVTDFGIARARGTGTLVPTKDKIMGSVRYMSPEQARGRHTDVRADIYSVGVVLYEMLTGQVPYDAETDVAIALEHIQGRPLPASTVRDEIPRQLDEIIACAMSKDPAWRYGNSRDMRQDLIAVKHGEPPAHCRDAGSRDDTRVVETVKDSREEPRVPRVRSRGGRGDDNGGGLDEPPPTPRGRFRFVWVLLLLVTLGVVGYSAYLVWDWFTVPVIEVPEVTGQRLATAEAVLEEHGLRAEIVASMHDDDVPANHVMRQRPKPGEEVRRGQTVELTISEGPHWVDGGVPDVMGMRSLEARVTLENVGLTVEITEEYHEDVPSGYVIDLLPGPGTRVQRGTSVTLEVSLGPEPRPFVLPGYIGLTLTEVLAELDEVGLESRVVREVADFPAGVVVSQDPAAGTEVTTGDTLTLVVSQGDEEEAHEEVISVSLPEQPGVQMVRIDVMDHRGHRVVYHDRVEGGTEFDVTIYWYGTGARAFVYSGDSVVQAVTFRR